ncbi:SDR family NAD(P)-dependent oxidoreductase [Alkalihalophilus marmarensis]|uniref:SDR family NAD(P)-dependent oxidoreductase n=1 Tax=Alkalihalophilus marmarensis TaxID=521377 RepID=UPI002DB646E7|nr:SDR family oxidoreductase [Alkalihalophilus marmarensis]MEC2070628.1 SDR family oxidoreductase [Alkalihalophilus marmarensis]
MSEFTRLENKVIWITGASSGLGRQLAIDAAAAGAVLVLLARNEAKLKEVQQVIQETSGRAHIYTLDISKTEDIEASVKNIFEKVQRVDILINNAGFGVFDYADRMNSADTKEMFDVNVLGLIEMTRPVLSLMKEANQGHIINVASQAGKLATPKSSVYAATKHAVLGYTNALRLELADTNIHVTAVNPGPIRTPFFDRADEDGRYVANIEKFMLTPEYVSKEILKVIEKPKREINLPKWMGFGSKLYQLMPGVVEKLAGSKLRQK